MTDTTHPALETLRKIRDIAGSTGGLRVVVDEHRHLAREAIPALEALLAERETEAAEVEHLRKERDELRAALEALLPLACESYTEGARQIRIARAALDKREDDPGESELSHGGQS